MTLKIPRWLLWCLGVVALVASGVATILILRPRRAPTPRPPPPITGEAEEIDAAVSRLLEEDSELREILEQDDPDDATRGLAREFNRG